MEFGEIQEMLRTQGEDGAVLPELKRRVLDDDQGQHSWCIPGRRKDGRVIGVPVEEEFTWGDIRFVWQAFESCSCTRQSVHFIRCSVSNIAESVTIDEAGVVSISAQPHAAPAPVLDLEQAVRVTRKNVDHLPDRPEIRHLRTGVFEHFVVRQPHSFDIYFTSPKPLMRDFIDSATTRFEVCELRVAGAAAERVRLPFFVRIHGYITAYWNDKNDDNPQTIRELRLTFDDMPLMELNQVCNTIYLAAWSARKLECKNIQAIDAKVHKPKSDSYRRELVQRKYPLPDTIVTGKDAHHLFYTGNLGYPHSNNMVVRTSAGRRVPLAAILTERIRAGLEPAQLDRLAAICINSESAMKCFIRK